MTRRNPYRAALAVYPDAEIIGRLWRLAALEDARRRWLDCKAFCKRHAGQRDEHGARIAWTLAQEWELLGVTIEIDNLRGELADLGYQLPAATRPQAATTGGDDAPQT